MLVLSVFIIRSVYLAADPIGYQSGWYTGSAEPFRLTYNNRCLLAAVLQKLFNASDPTNHLSVHRISPPVGNLGRIQAGFGQSWFERTYDSFEHAQNATHRQFQQRTDRWQIAALFAFSNEFGGDILIKGIASLLLFAASLFF